MLFQWTPYASQTRMRLHWLAGKECRSLPPCSNSSYLRTDISPGSSQACSSLPEPATSAVLQACCEACSCTPHLLASHSVISQRHEHQRVVGEQLHIRRLPSIHVQYLLHPWQQRAASYCNGR